MPNDFYTQTMYCENCMRYFTHDFKWGERAHKVECPRCGVSMSHPCPPVARGFLNR